MKTLFLLSALLLSGFTSNVDLDLSDLDKNQHFIKIVEKEAFLLNALAINNDDLNQIDISELEKLALNEQEEAVSKLFGFNNIITFYEYRNSLDQEYKLLFASLDLSELKDKEVQLNIIYKLKASKIMSYLGYSSCDSKCSANANACFSQVPNVPGWGGAAITALGNALCQAAYLKCDLSCKTAAIGNDPDESLTPN